MKKTICVSRTLCLTKESRSLLLTGHGVVILPNIRYTVGYLNKVFCSYESLRLNVHAEHKKATMTYISWFKSFALNFQEHVMYGHYAFDYESGGSVKLRRPSHDNHLTVYSKPWCYHIDRITTVMNP